MLARSVLRDPLKLAALPSRCCSKAASQSTNRRADCIEKNNAESEIRLNSMGIQMLPPSLYKQIFKPRDTADNSEDELLLLREKASIEKLKKFDLWGKNSEIIPNVEFDLPDLHGSNIDEHFKSIASEQCGSYVSEIFRFCSHSLPEKPNKWCKRPGWTKYEIINGHLTGWVWTRVDYPDEKALVFDCEVLVTENEFPVMAVAASPTHWYTWCSPRIFQPNINGSSPKLGISSLIPMEKRRGDFHGAETNPRVVVGHNVSYDRARIREQYYIEESGIRFVDTMSMHIAISGFSGDQRNVLKSNGSKTESKGKSTWLGAGSMNSLSDTHQFYCGKSLEKTARDIFVVGTIQDVQTNFDELMTYCSNDVIATHNVLKKVFPVFCQRFPNPVTTAAMLEMGMMYLPTNRSWQRFIQNADSTYNDLDKELKSTLINVANDACSLSLGEKYQMDPWLSDLDWTKRSYKLLKSRRKDWEPQEYTKPHNSKPLPSISESDMEFLCITKDQASYTPSSNMKSILDTAASLPKIVPHMPGYPKWYSELCMKHSDPNWEPGPVKLSTLTKITPKLLRMTWNGYRLHHDRTAGWGYLVPKQDGIEDVGEVIPSTLDDYLDSDFTLREADDLKTRKPIQVPDIPEDCLFYKLPHRLGYDHNVGNPLSHDFLPKMEDGTLKSSDTIGATRCLEINLASSYWRGSRQRVYSQIFITLPQEGIPHHVRNHPDFTADDVGAILPKTIVFGTVSRRAVEPVWLTASNVKDKRIGSELKGMIQAPPGYTFVGADVDSQELWIASLLGDADFSKQHGCTPFSWMTLEGSKSKGTDLHSKTAETIGITRDQAKVFNYARIYGSGQRLAKLLLQKYNPDIGVKEASEKVKELFLKTKGSRKYFLSTNGRYYANKLKGKINPIAVQGGLVTLEEVKTLEKVAKSAFGHLIDIQTKDLVAGRVWDGGMESEVFNRLEKIARNMNPRTPVLDARISTALEPSKVQENFLPTRMNWVVQSSAVDYLHLLLVCMRWLIKKYSIKARFAISIHDEIRYLCAEEDRHRTALALQISNILTRCLFAYRVGMEDLPLGVAFFSSVEIDKALRKHHMDDCVTPSNPAGLRSSCGIPLGQSLDIYELLEQTRNLATNDSSR